MAETSTTAPGNRIATDASEASGPAPTLDVIVVCVAVGLTLAYVPFLFVPSYTPRLALVVLLSGPGIVGVARRATNGDYAARVAAALSAWIVVSAISSGHALSALIGVFGWRINRGHTGGVAVGMGCGTRSRLGGPSTVRTAPRMGALGERSRRSRAGRLQHRDWFVPAVRRTCHRLARLTRGVRRMHGGRRRSGRGPKRVGAKVLGPWPDRRLRGHGQSLRFEVRPRRRTRGDGSRLRASSPSTPRRVADRVLSRRFCSVCACHGLVSAR